MAVTTNGNKIQVTTQKGDDYRTAQTQSTQAGVNPIDAVTLTQALNYLNGNVVDLTTAKDYLRQLTKLVFVLRAEVKRRE